MPRFPDLPIVTPDPPPSSRSETEKYGSLYYLGIAGLVVVVALVVWFGVGVWQLRDLWTNIYRLNQPELPEAERVNAAWAIRHDPGVSQRQLWDLAMSRVPPPLARYILAEGLTAEAIQADPTGYVLSVARSEGWPQWLRLLLMRPMAYDDGKIALAPDPLKELRRNPDPFVRLWAAYIQARVLDVREPREFLEHQSEIDRPQGEMARRLVQALDAPSKSARLQSLDRASLWMRHHHPASAALWRGWTERDGHFKQTPARQLQRDPSSSADEDSTAPDAS
jgi:hypothetical protein